MSNEKFHVPELTAENFIDWESKMKAVLKAKGLYQLILTKEPRRRDAKGKFVKEDDLDLATKLDLAYAVIVTRISDSVSGRLKKNGGDECPIQLWSNIQEFGASKKQANVFKAWHKLYSLRIDPKKVDNFISAYWECITTLRSLDINIDEESLGHHILSIIPASLGQVRNTLISSGTSSLIPVTFESVLELLDSQVKANIPLIAPSDPHSSSDQALDAAHALITQTHCPPGKHLPSANHSSSSCFSLHPELLKKYRDSLNNRKTEAHHTAIATDEHPTSYHSVATPHQDPLFDPQTQQYVENDDGPPLL